jgi:hypothetical protein
MFLLFAAVAAVQTTNTTFDHLALSRQPLAPLGDFIPDAYKQYVPAKLLKTCVLNSFDDQTIIETTYPKRFKHFIVFTFQDEPYNVPLMNEMGEKSKEIMNPNAFNVLCDYANWPERFQPSLYVQRQTME